MRLANYARWGVLGATIGLMIGIALAPPVDPGIPAPTRAPNVEFPEFNAPRRAQPGATIDWEKLARNRVKDKSTTLFTIASIRYQCGDSSGAIKTIEDIPKAADRDAALFSLVMTFPEPETELRVVRDANSQDTRANPASSSATQGARKDADRTRVDARIKDERFIVAAMKDHQLKAIALCRIACHQFVDLGDRAGSQETFNQAVEEARSIELPTAILGSTDESREEPEPRNQDRIFQAILSRFSSSTLLIFAALGGLAGLVSNAIVKQLVGDTARIVNSEEQLRSAYSRLGSWWQKRRKTVHVEAIPSPEGAPQDCAVNGDVPTP